jgi:hypothetical protein
MTSDLKNALRSTRDMDEYLEVRSTREIIEDIKATAGQETLRDQFAMAALQGHLAYSHYNESWGDYHNNGSHDGLAGRCYDLADAMLKVRALPPPTRSDAAD